MNLAADDELELVAMSSRSGDDPPVPFMIRAEILVGEDAHPTDSARSRGRACRPR